MQSIMNKCSKLCSCTMARTTHGKWVMLLAFVAAFLCGPMLESFINNPSTIYRYNHGWNASADEMLSSQIEEAAAIATAKRARIFCMIFTTPKSKNRADAVRTTWGKKCDGIVFISSEANETTHTIAAVKVEGAESVWPKTIFAIKYVAEQFANDYDYFIKVEDSSFVVMKNLRMALVQYSQDTPILMGYQSKKDDAILSSDVAYALSRAGLVQLRNGLLGNGLCSDLRDHSALYNIQRCAKLMHVKQVSGVDSTGLERFHVQMPKFQLVNRPHTGMLYIRGV